MSGYLRPIGAVAVNTAVPTGFAALASVAKLRTMAVVGNVMRSVSTGGVPFVAVLAGINSIFAQAVNRQTTNSTYRFAARTLFLAGSTAGLVYAAPYVRLGVISMQAAARFAVVTGLFHLIIANVPSCEGSGKAEPKTKGEKGKDKPDVKNDGKEKGKAEGKDKEKPKEAAKKPEKTDAEKAAERDAADKLRKQQQDTAAEKTRKEQEAAAAERRKQQEAAAAEAERQKQLEADKAPKGSKADLHGKLHAPFDLVQNTKAALDAAKKKIGPEALNAAAQAIEAAKARASDAEKALKAVQAKMSTVDADAEKDDKASMASRFFAKDKENYDAAKAAFDKGSAAEQAENGTLHSNMTKAKEVMDTRRKTYEDAIKQFKANVQKELDNAQSRFTNATNNIAKSEEALRDLQDGGRAFQEAQLVIAETQKAYDKALEAYAKVQKELEAAGNVTKAPEYPGSKV